MSAVVTAVATAAKSSGIVQVKVGSQIVPAQCPRDLTVAAGDPLLVVQAGSGWYVIQRYFTSSSGNTDPGASNDPPPAPVLRKGQTTFRPTRTASWRDTFGGWRTDNDDVYQGEFDGNGNHIGCWFYGGGPKSLSGATVTDAWISVRRKSAGGGAADQTTTIGHITEQSKPSGMPTFGGATTGPRLAWGETDSHFDIANSVAQGIVNGTWGGLGIHISGSSPYVILQGLSSYGASGALTIKWQRTS